MSKLLFSLCIVAVIATAMAASPPVQVFVTKGKYTGKQVGYFGSTICDFEASSYGVSGFKAVYGKTGDKLKFKVPDFGTFVNTEGDTVAVDSGFFLSLVNGVKGGLQANILTLDGEYSDSASVWTGYDNTGVASDNCQNWTSEANTQMGYGGAFQPATVSGSIWFTGKTHTCDMKKPLICLKETAATTCDGKELALGTTPVIDVEEVVQIQFGRRCFIKNPLLSGFNIKGSGASGYCCRTSGKIVAGTPNKCRTGCTGFQVDTPNYKYTYTGNTAGQSCWVDCYRLEANF